jgi:hypothetical protein
MQYVEPAVHIEEWLMGRTMPQCPQCEVIELRRQGRTGFLQKVVWSYFGYYPWECGLCRQIYMLKQRATSYRQHATPAPVARNEPSLRVPNL